jgi:hypothetical protein
MSVSGDESTPAPTDDTEAGDETGVTDQSDDASPASAE